MGNSSRLFGQELRCPFWQVFGIIKCDKRNILTREAPLTNEKIYLVAKRNLLTESKETLQEWFRVSSRLEGGSIFSNWKKFSTMIWRSDNQERIFVQGGFFNRIFFTDEYEKKYKVRRMLMSLGYAPLQREGFRRASHFSAIKRHPPTPLKKRHKLVKKYKFLKGIPPVENL